MKDVDLAMKSITIRNGKGMKARVVPIPERLLVPIQSVMVHRKERHIQGTLQGAGYVYLPWAFERKSPKPAQSIQWQYLFSSGIINIDKKNRSKNALALFHIDTAKVSEESSRTGGHYQASHLSYIETFLCDPSIKGRGGYPHYSTTTGT